MTLDKLAPPMKDDVPVALLNACIAIASILTVFLVITLTWTLKSLCNKQVHPSAAVSALPGQIAARALGKRIQILKLCMLALDLLGWRYNLCGVHVPWPLRLFHLRS